MDNLLVNYRKIKKWSRINCRV